MRLTSALFVFTFLCVSRADPDHALRAILNVSGMRMALPNSGAKYEVTCFYYEGGKGKRAAGMALDVAAASTAELLWRTEANRTRLVLSTGQQTSTAYLPNALEGEVGGGADNSESVQLGEGWTGVSYFTFSKLPPGGPTSVPQTVLTLDKLEKMIKDPARKTLVLAYRLKGR